MFSFQALLSVLLLPILLTWAFPEPSRATTAPALLPRASDDSLTPAQASLLGAEFASWTASVAAASAKAVYTPLVLTHSDVPGPDVATCQIHNSGPDFNVDNCAAVYPAICQKLLGSANGSYAADTWVWSDSGDGGCAMGYWYPSGARGVAPVPPDMETCTSNVSGIWSQMQQLCIKQYTGEWRYGRKWNAASVNVGQLPYAGNTGTARDPRKVSYILANSPFDGGRGD